MAWVLLLGIGSGLCWGTADFFGGLQSRRLPALAVAFWSQVAGGAALIVTLLALGETPVSGSILWGMASGIFGGLGLVLFYRGLAVGVMSLVAPISACGAVVPVLWELARGIVPSALASAGIAAALAGIVLVSLQPEGSSHPHAQPRLSVLLALGAAFSFGMFFIFLDRGSAVPAASPLWAVAGARISSLLTLLGLIAARPGSAPWVGSRFPAVAAIGVVDTIANVLFAYASTQGHLAIVSVLGSLYPVATVLLGRFILSERLNHVQHAGIVLALSGVALLSAG